MKTLWAAGSSAGVSPNPRLSGSDCSPASPSLSGRLWAARIAMTSAATVLSVVAGPAGPVPALSDGEAESPLSAVSEAYSAWKDADDHAKRMRSILVESVMDARSAGAKLAEIAAQMRVTRQMVQKIIREAAAGEAAADAEAAYYEARANRDYKRDKAGIGRTNCFSCGAFKSLPSAVCTLCGDEPGTYNGSTFETDEAYIGHRVLR